ncbi:MAG: DUF126 domain-containing protein [Candidatus Methanomethylophilaceae archaeon]
MISLTGRSISVGKSIGEAVVLDTDFSFLGGVDPDTGDLRVPPYANIKDKVLVFPRGRGSTVGSFTMYDLKVKGNAPAAIINKEAETIVTTGAVISSIPMVDRVDISVINNGDRVEVDGSKGTVSLLDLESKGVATSILVKGGRVLMLKRSKSMTIFPGQWGGVSGTMEEGESPEETAVREVGEETKMSIDKPIRKAHPILVRHDQDVWTVHPLLFHVETGEPILNWENSDHAWMNEEEVSILETVPGMKEVLRSLQAWED